ncbi:MAG: DinB family protein [Ardenticatenales bacterium]|nr:DinB family protein [Ardenticatenales bacterium]
MTEQKRLIDLLASARRETLAALGDVNDLAMVYAESGWRVKDVLGHLAAWEREVLASLQAYHEQDEYTLGPEYVLDAYNEATFERRKEYDPAQCRMDWGMVRRDLQFAVQEIAPDRLDGPVCYPWGAQGTVTDLIEEVIQHEAAHLKDILAAIHLT